MRALATHPAARGLNDDAAVLKVGGETLVITHDMMVEGTHFFADADMADVAWKLVAVNLSDLAAKGAQPVGVLLGHMLGRDDDRFLAGLQQALAKYGVPLLGGDTVRGEGPRSFGLTAIGTAHHTPVPSRSGAKAGDALYMCGTVGDAMAGFHELTTSQRAAKMGLTPNPAVKPDPYFSARFLRPEPLLAQGAAIAPFATSMMDISDGLFLDASRIAAASNVTLSITLDEVLHSSQFRAYAAQGNQLDVLSGGRATRMAACSWGDDYALLFTAKNGVDLPAEAAKIGTVLPPGDSAILVDGAPPDKGMQLGYSH